jgi:hypothetical protein
VLRDLIQPRRARLLQLHKLLLQVAEPRPYARELVLALRFGEAPVVDVAGRSDALCEQNTLRPVRVKLEPERLLNSRFSERTFVAYERARIFPPEIRAQVGV